MISLQPFNFTAFLKEKTRERDPCASILKKKKKVQNLNLKE